MSITKILVFTIIASASAIIIFSFINKPDKIQANTMKKGFAVVELFTSEGCSSCPPADAAIADLSKKNIDNVYILSFHVDYWNRLGWKDPFSSEAYSERQGYYSRALGLNGVYTPQIVVNGTNQFVGSDENTLKNVVTKNLRSGVESRLKINAIKINNSVVVNYEVPDGSNVFLNCALLLPEATTQVRRGENSGRSLYHVNIVKSLKVAEINGSGQLSMSIPPDLLNNKFKVIAFTQKKKNLEITGADEAEL